MMNLKNLLIVYNKETVIFCTRMCVYCIASQLIDIQNEGKKILFTSKVVGSTTIYMEYVLNRIYWSLLNSQNIVSVFEA